MNHMDFNPVKASQGELIVAYQDMSRIADKISTENSLLYQRQGRLETWIRSQVDATIDRTHGTCIVGACLPRYEHSLARFVHVAPCRMAAAEEILRERVSPYDSETLPKW